jgi:nucleolar protein 56
MEKTKDFLGKYYFANLNETKKKVKVSVSADNLIIQTIKNIDDLQKSGNLLCKRLRDWYSLYNPEFSKALEDNKKFTELIIKNSKKDLLRQIGVKESESMGADLPEYDVEEILLVAKQVNSIYTLIDLHERYIEKLMKANCPNMTEVAGHMIGAKLIEHAGSIKKLAGMTSSTVQLLGAEKALFRHMKTGAKTPKHGLIIQHPLVANAKAADRGKAARWLADKITIAVRVDYFKGRFIGDKLKIELEKKLNR